MGEFRMPSLGADMDVGTIIEWLVGPGDEVSRGQIVAVVDTAKAAIEIEAFESGVLEEILVGVGAQVPVGTPLAIIGAGSTAASTVPSVKGVATVAPARGGPAGGVGEEAAGIAEPLLERPHATPPVRHLAHQLGVDLDAIVGSGPDGRVTHDDLLRAAEPGRVAEPVRVASGSDRASLTAARVPATPRARRLALERGIDLSAVAGSGVGGAVLASDVERAAREAERARRAARESAAAPVLDAESGGPGTGEPDAVGAPGAAPPSPSAESGAPGGSVPRGAARTPAAPTAGQDRKAAMRTAIANLMSRSNTEIPHYYVTQTIDLATSLTWLRAHNTELPVARRLLPAVLFLRATVLAALVVPELNGHWVDGALRPADRVDLGVAVATRGGGLVTPAIPDAGPLGVDELMARLADLVGRARRGSLRQAEMAGASITVSSLGETGPDALFGVIFPPQVALVGVGGIIERPWAVGGMLTVRPTATVTLAADHRASDGRTASAFLAAFSHALEHPEEL